MRVFLILILFITIASFILPASVTYAITAENAAWTNYQPITDIASLGRGTSAVSGNNLTIGDFIKIVYGLSISVAALLAVIKIIYGGVQFMLTDVVTSKENARKDIQGALFGLLIVISAVLLLNIISPQFTSLDILNNIEKMKAGNRVNNPAPVAPTPGAGENAAPETQIDTGPDLQDFGVGSSKLVTVTEDLTPYAESCPGQISTATEGIGAVRVTCNAPTGGGQATPPPQNVPPPIDNTGA